jgi:hypothetical protein
MMSFIHYMSAKRRLKESEKTVFMMGGEREAPPMILAQRDMIKLEVKYYEDEAFLLGLILFALAIFGITLYNLLKLFGKI